MSQPSILGLLWFLLAATLIRAHLSPEVIQERLTGKLKDHGAESILQQLPLLSAMLEESASDGPVVSRLLCSVLSKMLQTKITSVHILQLQALSSADSLELSVKVPLHIEVEFKIPLVKGTIELQVAMEAQATLKEETTDSGEKSLILSACSSSQENLHLSLEHNVSFLVRPVVNKMTSLLTPVLPKLVKRQLCPVIEAAVQELQEDIQQSVTYKPERPMEPEKMESAS